MLNRGLETVNQRPEYPKSLHFLYQTDHGAVFPFVSKFAIAAKTHKPLEQTWVLIIPCRSRLVKENTLTVSCGQWCRTFNDMELRVLALGLQKITMT